LLCRAGAARGACRLRHRRHDRSRHIRRAPPDRPDLDRCKHPAAGDDQHDFHHNDEHHVQQLAVEQLVELRLLGREQRGRQLGLGLRWRQPVDQHRQLERDGRIFVGRHRLGHRLRVRLRVR
jgi:hypothetical protein